jgi:hypothetical protein
LIYLVNHICFDICCFGKILWHLRA